MPGPAQEQVARGRALISALTLAFVLFIVLGLPEGVIGTVWPTLRSELGLAVGDLGWLVAARTFGFVAATVASGHVSQRWGSSRTLLAALAMSIVGYSWMAVAGSLRAVLAASVIAGAGSGWVDPVLNAWVALRHDARAMGMLHAFFGVGAAIGPPFAIGVIEAGLTWRVAFAALAFLDVALILLLWWHRAGFRTEPMIQRDIAGEAGSQPRLILGLMLLWFFMIVGTELSVGSWSFSLLVEERAVSNTEAAAWVAAFWVLFTVGRFAMGAIGNRLHLRTALWASVALVALGAVLLWAHPSWLPAGAALPLLGLGSALLFPVMVLLTPRWLGAARTEVATGYQLAAASLGSVSFAVAVGRLADRYSLEVLGPILVMASLILAAVLWLLERAGHRTQPHSTGG